MTATHFDLLLTGIFEIILPYCGLLVATGFLLKKFLFDNF